MRRAVVTVASAGKAVDANLLLLDWRWMGSVLWVSWQFWNSLHWTRAGHQNSFAGHAPDYPTTLLLCPSPWANNTSSEQRSALFRKLW